MPDSGLMGSAAGAQVTYEDSDTTASSALAKQLRDTGGSTIYVPGFGNAAVDNIKEITVPASPKISLYAPGPASLLHAPQLAASAGV